MPQADSPGFPPSAQSRMFDALVAALKADPVLSARVQLWQVWDGDDDAQRDPTGDDTPYLRLDSTAASGSWLDESTHRVEWPIRVEIGVAGSRLGDLLDFWAAVQAALFTGNAVLNQLIPLGLIQKTIAGVASAPAEFGGTVGLTGVGTITLRMRIDT